MLRLLAHKARTANAAVLREADDLWRYGALRENSYLYQELANLIRLAERIQLRTGKGQSHLRSALWEVLDFLKTDLLNIVGDDGLIAGPELQRLVGLAEETLLSTPP